MEGAPRGDKPAFLDGTMVETPPGIVDGFGRRRFQTRGASEVVSQASRTEENAGAEGCRPRVRDRGPCQERTALVPRVIDAKDVCTRAPKLTMQRQLHGHSSCPQRLRSRWAWLWRSAQAPPSEPPRESLVRQVLVS